MSQQKPSSLAIDESAWRKSSLSGAGQGDCVEVAFADGFIAVRDSKNKGQRPLIFTQSEWRAFLGGVAQNEFDLK